MGAVKSGHRQEMKEFVKSLEKRVIGYYGERLVSFVIFGSVARGTHRPDSDIDCLIVTTALPRGRLRRVSEFMEHVEKPLEGIIRTLRKTGIQVSLSPIFKTVEEVQRGSPLFLDMVYDVMILHDSDGFFERYLAGLKGKLETLGSKRVVRGNAWYWILKPDYKYGDVIEL